MTRVLVNGARGRMGTLACAAIAASGDLELVGRCGRGDDLAEAIRSSGAEVVVDFTRPEVVRRSALAIVDAGARPVIGTSGLDATARALLVQRCAERRLGGIIAPNFAIGAILMIRFAETAARHLSGVEIVESHHAAKVDAPSGTAIATADAIARARGQDPAGDGSGGSRSAARGDHSHGVPIHSVRLEGVVAEQTVTFGAAGQKLVLEHVTYSREAYMPGVLLACRRVVTLDRLAIGLESLLF